MLAKFSQQLAIWWLRPLQWQDKGPNTCQDRRPRMQHGQRKNLIGIDVGVVSIGCSPSLLPSTLIIIHRNYHPHQLLSIIATLYIDCPPLQWLSTSIALHCYSNMGLRRLPFVLCGTIFQGSTYWVFPKGMPIEHQSLINIHVAKYLGKITRIMNNEVTHIVAFD